MKFNYYIFIGFYIKYMTGGFMKILVVGGGAREHAIGEAILKNKKVSEIFFAPGNAGTCRIGTNINIKADDIDSLLDFAYKNSIDFTVVGPEDPLCLGIVDTFEAHGLRIFGPTKAAAMLEGSKHFAKEFMVKNNIPTAEYHKSETYEDCMSYASRLIKESGKAVLKADTLCQGKGVFIAESLIDAEDFCKKVLIEKIFGECSMVVEEYLDGFEMSLLCFVDNNTIKPLPTVKDHKKIHDGERGLNTGGMGTYSPNSQADIYLPEIESTVLTPFLDGIKKDALDFRGIIFIGFMIGTKGIKVLEFNTRFGDPETQTVLQRLETDLLDIMLHTSDSNLNGIDIRFNDKKVITLVISSGGYPEKYETGCEITGLENVSSKVFHAGTAIKDGKPVTSGGRVISLTSCKDTFEEAFNLVYSDAKAVDFKNKYYRRDISPLVKRIYVEKKEKFNEEGKHLLQELKDGAGIELNKVRCLVRYDIENLTDDELIKISDSILSEKPVDDIYMFEDALYLQKNLLNPLVIQYHNGQFDQREQGLLETIAVSIEKNEVMAKCARVYDFVSDSKLESDKMKKIESIMINPVDQKKGSLFEIPTTLKDEFAVSHENEIHCGFTELSNEELYSFIKNQSLAMNIDDIKFVQDYFRKENRDPSTTEISILDTYWSDHCRHTTFNTILNNIEFAEPLSDLDASIRASFDEYIKNRSDLGISKPLTLMDMATVVSKQMRKKGMLEDLEVSEEINACSVKIKVRVEDRITREERLEDYLLMFKNETHNHPTEIEPFGGASTCIGGAIRDPLSGRSYVYQAMRVTGSADPREKIEDTIEGKLPQRKITIDAARGYSSYGNQIGIATGHVDEIYHEGYKAKRMEVGAVIGAAPAENVKRESPVEGDLIILLGGRTGRDGVGGATGSSKEHTEKSIEISSAEVQKGNAPMERKLQRLFRNEGAAKLIKKCNDFGAGGVSVAIGELADSLEIYLARVPLKYKGLTPREIAISESQERMAVVIDKDDLEKFAELCYSENLEMTHVATVTDTGRLIMKYNDEIIVDIDRDFLNSSGADRNQDVRVENCKKIEFFNSAVICEDESGLNKLLEEKLSDLNSASKKNLIERFDSSIGRGSVLLPLGGKNQITPAQSMVALIPSLNGATKTASIMSYGFNPYLSEESPYLGAYYAVIESIAKIAAAGGNALSSRLSFQEYFEKLGNVPEKWAKPFTALLGAYNITSQLNIPPIGGKDSMSGTFKDLNVPPTLISFAVASDDVESIITPELKGGMMLGLIETEMLSDYTLDTEHFVSNLDNLRKEISSGNICSCYAVNHKGMLPMILEMSFGNDVSFEITVENLSELFQPKYGSFIVEYKKDSKFIKPLGFTLECAVSAKASVNGIKLDIEKIKKSYLGQLDKVFSGEIYESESSSAHFASKSAPTEIKNEINIKSIKTVERPKVVIPVFPGTNCEWDTAKAFEDEGADAEIIVFNNLSIDDIEKSIEKLRSSIEKSQILVFPGGFSMGDEPDGSGKFIANVIRNPKITSAIEKMLNENDGLILGICNGFQALIKTGLLPYGEVRQIEATSPTLTYNNNARHIARIVQTRAVNTTSPWTRELSDSAIYKIPVSHGEGRFICSEESFAELNANGQIAFLYEDNPNGSAYNIEGILSPCGRILGKMAHSERIADNLYKNMPGLIPQPIIKSGVNYFKK